ncbi:hypothetical protein GCM10027187_64340 [Streptosporangium sandarakinum]
MPVASTSEPMVADECPGTGAYLVAYCPKAAHGRAGYAKVTGRRHTCARYSNGQWRWKRARANAKCPLPAGGPAGKGRCHRRRAGVVPSVVVDDASPLRAC